MTIVINSVQQQILDKLAEIKNLLEFATVDGQPFDDVLVEAGSNWAKNIEFSLNELYNEVEYYIDN